MQLWELALLVLAGFAAGWINVLAGGGSMFTVAAMTFMGFPGPVANGTNRIAVIAQSLSAVGAFLSKGLSEFRLSASLSAAASIGAFFGAKAGVALDGVWFERTLALTMLVVLALMATSRDAPAQEDPSGGRPRNFLLGHALMVGAGAWGGFIQIGVGFLIMPILYRVMGIGLVQVNVHKVFIALVFTSVSFAVFASAVPIRWDAGAALAVGTIAGAWLGAHSTLRHGAKLIRRVFFAMIAAMAVKLLFF